MSSYTQILQKSVKKLFKSDENLVWGRPGGALRRGSLPEWLLGRPPWTRHYSWTLFVRWWVQAPFVGTLKIVNGSNTDLSLDGRFGLQRMFSGGDSFNFPKLVDSSLNK